MSSWRTWQPSIVDQKMHSQELLTSVLAELDGFRDGKWLPTRAEITKRRVQLLVRKVRDESTIPAV